MSSNDLEAVPRDRNVLVKTMTFHYDEKLSAYVFTGTKWVEARWVEDRLRAWCGSSKIQTTENIVPIAWAELPE